MIVSVIVLAEMFLPKALADMVPLAEASAFGALKFLLRELHLVGVLSIAASPIFGYFFALLGVATTLLAPVSSASVSVSK